MADGHSRHGQDSNEVVDLPVVRHEIRSGEHDHRDNAKQRKCHAEFEALEHFRHLNEEVRELGLLGRGTPGHIDFEHVRQKSLGDMERKSTKEDGEHECPLEVLN